MARLSTVYDKDLKEQVLMLRGDESYARTTKTFLTLGATSIQQLSFSLSVTVNVLRDRGNGTILIYDNDVLVYTIDDWTSQDNARTIVLTGLAFDIQHNIVARYMGNNKCSPSHSTTETITVADTHRAESTLTLQSPIIQFTPNASYSDTIILSNTQSSTYNAKQKIDIYYDDVFIQTITTENNGKKAFSIPDVGNVGLHKLVFRFAGSKNLTSTELKVELSVGYNIVWTNVPSSPVVMGVSKQWQGRVTDFFNTALGNESVLVLASIKDPRMAQENVTISLTTDSDGYFTFTNPYTYKAQAFIKSQAYSSKLIELNYVIPDSLTITSSKPRLYKNEQNSISIQTNSSYENTPIVLTGDATGTIYTDSNGLAVKTLTGTGKGSKTVTAQFGNITKTITLEDYTIYYSRLNEFVNKGNFDILYGGLNYLKNYFSVGFKSNSNLATISWEIESNYEKSWRATIENISSQSPIQLASVDLSDGVEVSGLTPTHQYTNGRMILTKPANSGFGTIEVYDDNTIIHSETIPIYSGIAFIQNGNVNPQISFRLFTYKEL